MQRLPAAALQCPGQADQRRLQIIGDPFRIDPCRALHVQLEAVAPVVHRYRQRIVGALLHFQYVDAGPRGRRRLRRIGQRTMAIVQQRTEQGLRRRHTAAALCQRQRRVFVAQQRAQLRMHGPGAGQHVLSVHRHPQRQRIDEQAQRAFGTAPPLQPAHQHRAEHHIVAAAQRRHDPGPGQVMQARRADARLPCLLPQAAAQGRIQPQGGFLDGATVALHVLQTEGQRGRLHVAQHLAEKSLVRGQAGTLPRLGHVVPVGHHGGQPCGLPRQVSLHFLPHPLQCQVVQHQVMEQQHRHAAARHRIAGVDQFHQRRLANRQQPATAGIERRSKRIGQIGTRFRRSLLHAQPGLPPDHLHRLIQALPHHGRAQDRMAIDHGLQGLCKSVDTLAVRHAEHRVQDIGVPLLRGQVVIENPFLQRCQRVDVFDIGSAAGHLRHDAVDGLLAQRRQWQHGGRDPFAARFDARRRQRLARLRAGAGPALDEFDQRRLVLAQRRRHGRIAERLPVAAHDQAAVLDRELHTLFFQPSKQFHRHHSTISIGSTSAARPANVGWVNNTRTSADKPSSSIRAIRLIASSE